MLKLIRKAATSLLIAAFVLTPTLSEAAGYQYFRMYGHGGQMMPPGGQPEQGTLGFAMQAPANPTVGQAFAGTPQVAGAVGAPAFSVQNGSLPAGTSLNSSTGTITGTLSAVGTYDATLKVVDAVNSIGFASLHVVVSPALTAGWFPSTGKVGEAYVPAAPIAAGGRAPFAYSLSGAAPAGLVFSQANGLLTGTPTTEGAYSLSVTIVDADGRSASTGLKTLTIAPADVTGPTDPALAIAGTPGAVAQVGVGYSAHFSGSGGTAPYVFDLVAGSLPPGLALAADGTISGTPVTAGTYSGLQVRLSDAASTTALSGVFSIEVKPEPQLLISGSPSGAARVGASYSAIFTALDGSGAGYSFSLASGSLPPGLSLSTANGTQGLIAGTPTHVGTYSGIVVRVIDSHSNVANSTPFSITVSPIAGPALAVAGAPAANGEVGGVYTAAFSASGGTGSGYAFSIASGALPAGLTLSATGVLTGAPTVSGTFAFAVAVTDSSGDQAQASYSVAISDALAAPTAAFGNGEVGVSYVSAAPAAHGGLAPYAWALASGSLPAGLSLDSSTGIVSGLPIAASTAVFTLKVTDALGFVSPTSSALSLTINQSLTIAGSPQVHGEVGVVYAANFTASGGAGSGYAFSIASGTLPAGVMLSSAGALSGTPTTAGTFQFTVAVVDQWGGQAQASYSIAISDALTAPTATFANGEVGVSYTSAAPVVHGGLAPYVWSLASGSLPAGLSLDSSTGVVSGLPTKASTATFALQVADALGAVSPTSSVLSLTINQSLTIAGSPPVHGEVGGVYTANFTASGGTGSGYTFSIASGALPAGLTISSAGVLTGAPTTAGTFGFTVAVVDQGGGQAQASYSIAIAAALIAPTATFANGEIGVSYVSAAPTAQGGLAPYVWSLASGSLPAGLSLNSSTGVVSGLPTAATTAVFSLEVVDSLGFTSPASSPISLTIYPALTIAGALAANGEVGAPYSATLSASGSTGSGYSFSVASGALPAGLTISTAGVLSGAPTAAGNFGFTVAVTDSLGGQAQASYSIAVSGALAAPTASFANGEVGVSYTSAAPAAHGGLAPYVWSLASGSLPAGLSLNASTGVVSGLPTAATTAVFTLKVTDALGLVSPASSAISLTINQSLQISGTPPANGEVGASYTASFSATGGAGSGYVFSIASGALPAGLTLSAAGSLTGTPTMSGAFSFTVAVADSMGGHGQASHSITISDVLTAPTAAFSSGMVGVTYTSAAPTAHGGLAPYVWSLASGTLPAGLSLDGPTGVVSGVPSAASTATITLKVTDALGLVSPASSAISITIDPTLVISSGTYTLTLGNAANFTPALASGGSGIYSSYAVVNGTGSLSALGLSFNTTGTITGTPTVAGSWTGSVVVTDSHGHTATSGQVTVYVDPSISISGTPPTGQVNSSYNFALAISGGSGAYSSYSVANTSGTLAALGLSLSGGSITGTPNAAGTWSGTITVVDSHGSSKTSGSLTVKIDPTLLISGTPTQGNAGVAYSFTPTVSGGSGSYASYAVTTTSGTLGALGLTFTPSTGKISGSTPVAGSWTGTITVTDSDGNSITSSSMTIQIVGPLTISGTPTTGAVVGNAYSWTPSISGGTGPYAVSYTTTSGQTLTSMGLSFSGTTGTISGTPSSGGVWNGTISVTDAAKTTVVSSSLTLSVAGAAPTVSGGPLKTPWATNVAMPGATFTATGGVQPYTWTLAAGSTAVPAGLSISSMGVVSGTPTTAGTYNFNVKATNATGGQAGTLAVTLVVSSSSFVATSGGLDGLTINRWPGFNAAPLFTSTAYNASGSVTWAMTGQGASGLSINSSTGVVSGTLSSTYGVYPLTVTGTDAASHVASFAVTVTISHRSGSAGGSDPLAATIYLNGASCGTGTVGAATCSGTLSGVNSTLEIVYPVNVQSSQFVFNATTWPSAVNLEVSFGDGVSYTTCATGSVSSGTPTINCPASVSVYASHYRARVISMTGSMVNPGMKVNAYFDPP